MFSLQPLARNEDKKDHAGGIDQSDGCKGREGPPVEQLSDVRLSDANKVHERILAVASKGHQWVESILVRDEAVNCNCEWEKDLLGWLSAGILIVGKDEVYPNSSMARVIEEDEGERNPKGGEQREEANNQPHHHRRRN